MPCVRWLFHCRWIRSRRFVWRSPLHATLSLFGSVLRDDFTPQSDVDFLVEFLPNAPVGLFELARMESELARLLGHKVDLRTPLELGKSFRAQVLAEAEAVYVKGQ